MTESFNLPTTERQRLYLALLEIGDGLTQLGNLLLKLDTSEEFVIQVKRQEIAGQLERASAAVRGVTYAPEVDNKHINPKKEVTT